MKKYLACFALFFGLAIGLTAEGLSLQVVYTEGTVELRDAGNWRSLQIGDILALKSTVRLGKGACLELKGKSGTITVLRSGVIAVEGLVQESTRLGQSGLADMISSRLRKMSQGQAGGKESSAGVRGAEAGMISLQKSISLAYNESLEHGLQSLEAGQARLAYDFFRDALDLGTASLQVQAAILASRAAMESGQVGLAWDCLEGIEPGSDDPLRSLFHLTRGQVSLAGLDYSRAAKDFEMVLQLADGDVRNQQEALLSLGVCRKALGQSESAGDAWKQLVALEPQSELTRLAKDLLSQP